MTNLPNLPEFYQTQTETSVSDNTMIIRRLDRIATALEQISQNLLETNRHLDTIAYNSPRD